ncbi:MAG: metallophosphoesterase family protein [Rhodomicrobiaceae bacterium]
MFTLAQISDVHLSPLPRPAFYHLLSKRALGYVNWHRRRGHHRRDVLDRLMDDLLGHKPDHIAMTGDLVNIALPEEFRAVRVWLESIGGPDDITVIPGNHDAYVPFLRGPGYSQWQPYMSGNAAGLEMMEGYGRSFPFVRILGQIALVCLSTARATMPAMASGRVGRRQMRSAADLLERLGREGYCRVVLIHHPPLPGMTPWQRALHDARRFQKVLIENGAELVLHGHNHRVMLLRLHGRTGPIPIVGAPSASLASADPIRSAAYNFFSIAKGGNGAWRIDMRSRSLGLDGKFTERHEELLP